MKKVTFVLEEMACPACVKKIETALERTPGVVQTEVLFHSAKVKITYEEDKADAAGLRQVIKKLGYLVVSEKSERIG